MTIITIAHKGGTKFDAYTNTGEVKTLRHPRGAEVKNDMNHTFTKLGYDIWNGKHWVHATDLELDEDCVFEPYSNVSFA